MKIAHDPGHGYGHDNGACYGSVVEADLVLEIARACSSIPGFEHVLLRWSHQGPSFTNRGELANDVRPDLVICHHANAAAQIEAHGLMTFVCDDGDHVGYEVAKAIMAAAPPALKGPNHAPVLSRITDWTARAHWVLDHYRGRLETPIPCVLIEWGFLTNDRDRAFLVDLDKRPLLVAALAAGLESLRCST